MAGIPRNLIDEVKTHVSILDLAKDYFTLTNERGYLGIKDVNGSSDYSSLKIYPETNTYVRFSGKGGGDVIQFVRDTHIEGIDSFEDAILFLKKRIDPEFSIDITKNKVKQWSEMTGAERGKKMAEANNRLNENLKLDDNNRYIIAYLKKTRGIDLKVIYDEIDRGRLVQIITTNGSRALGCVGHDYTFPSVKTAVSVRGIARGSTYKGDLEGCNYDVGWVISNVEKKFDQANNRYINVRNANYNEKAHLYCFEGYIDYLSFKSIQRQHGNSMDKDICIVTGSSTKTKCIKNFLEDNKEKFKGANISLCFDRDEAGFKAIDKVATELKDLDMDLKINTALSLDKDWNDQLLNYDVTNNNQAIVIDKNKEAIIEVSQNKGKNKLYAVYEDSNNETNAYLFDYKRNDVQLFDCSKEGLNVVYDALENKLSSVDMKKTDVKVHEDYAYALKEFPERYPHIIKSNGLGKQKSIADRMKEAKQKSSQQTKDRQTISKNEQMR